MPFHDRPCSPQEFLHGDFAIIYHLKVGLDKLFEGLHSFDTSVKLLSFLNFAFIISDSLLEIFRSVVVIVKDLIVIELVVHLAQSSFIDQVEILLRKVYIM